MKVLNRILATVVLVGTTGISSAATLFSDDFESGLGQWTAGNGQIVADPAGGTNQVLNFSSLNSAGDIFSTSSMYSSNSNLFTLSFDYYGTSNNSGGFIGYSQGTPGSHVWLAGSDTNYSGTWLWSQNAAGPLTDRILIGDNNWHSYQLTFAGLFNPIRLMLEDFVGSDNTAGNAYFDNIVLTNAVPVPAAVWLFGTALIGLAGFSRRR